MKFINTAEYTDRSLKSLRGQKYTEKVMAPRINKRKKMEEKWKRQNEKTKQREEAERKIAERNKSEFKDDF